LSWISRYGSVTFSTFGKDMTDGGVNEVGLYIWEMSNETEPAISRALAVFTPRTSTTNASPEACLDKDGMDLELWGIDSFLSPVALTRQ
jgi:hypothetical protein